MKKKIIIKRRGKKLDVKSPKSVCIQRTTGSTAIVATYIDKEREREVLFNEEKYRKLNLFFQI